MNTWFNLPFVPLFLILAIPYVLISVLINWVVFHSPLRKKVQSLAGIAAP